MRSRTSSAVARDRWPISWQRRSKGRSALEARRSLRTTDRRIRSLTFTARSGRTRTIRRRITTSWRWLTSPDAASSRETWVILRLSELRGTRFLRGGGGGPRDVRSVPLGVCAWRCTNRDSLYRSRSVDSDSNSQLIPSGELVSYIPTRRRFVRLIRSHQTSDAVMVFREEIARNARIRRPLHPNTNCTRYLFAR